MEYVITIVIPCVCAIFVVAVWPVWAKSPMTSLRFGLALLVTTLLTVGMVAALGITTLTF